MKKNTKSNSLKSRLLHTLMLFLLMGLSYPIQAQNASKQIKGVVMDSKSQPLIGASVQIKGTTLGAMTNVDGEFSLNAPEKAVLVVSYVGFNPKEVTVDKSTTINVTLEEDTNLLDDVVVVGYGSMKRREVTSAIETVTADKFNAGASTNAMDLIRGKVAGLSITNVDGANPNSSPNIQLRGVSSIKGSKTPLIVIDGVPGGSLDLLSPDDIESFNVLKDGSAASIYGTRGSAGVILITTKKGKGGAPQFRYNTYFQHDVVNRTVKTLNASQYREHIAAGDIAATNDLGGSTDLFDELINKNNLTQYHNFSMSGGTEETNYRASVNYNKREGVTKQNSREQFGARINVNQTGLDNHLTVSLNLATNINKANLLGGKGEYFSQSLTRNPTSPIYNEDGTFFEQEAWDVFNPMSRLANRTERRNQQTTSGDLTARINIIDGLSWSTTIGYQRNSYNDRQYRSTNDWDQRVGTEYNGMGYAKKENFLDWRKTLTSQANFRHEFNDNNVLSVMVGYEYNYYTFEKFNVENNGFTTNGFLDWNLGAGGAINDTKLPRPGMGSEKKDNTLVSFFGRANYTFMSKYNLQVSMRREGSSKFGDNHKWGNFPSISASWSLSEENFIKDLDFFQDLKLRAGYGVTGTDGLDPYQSMILLGTGGVYPQDGTYYQTYGPDNNPNKDLKWEEQHDFNIGVDFSILNDRLSGSIDLFNRKAKDLLYQYNAQQPSYVRDNIWVNLGEITSKGIEFQLSGIPIQTENFSWNIDFTASTLVNKLTKLSNETFKSNHFEEGDFQNSTGALGKPIRMEEGWKVGEFYGYRYAGLTDDGKWLFYKKDGTKATTSEINDSDKAIIGNGLPKWQLSMTHTFKYKNWDLSLMFRSKLGFDIVNTKEMFLGNKTSLPTNVFPSAFGKYNDINEAVKFSDLYVERGDYVKLDNLTLGYKFPLNNKYVKNLRVYGTAQNLFTITSYNGVSPEIKDTGFDVGIDGMRYYPRTVTWTLGLQVGF